MNNGTVLIIGGGTGGHISPGLALYQEFKDRGVPVLFLSGNRDRRFSSLSEISADELIFYNAPGMTKNHFKIPLFVLRFAAAVLKIRKLIRKRSIAAVVGMGGYVSAPALFAARSKKIPFFLCEQNTVPGRVTRMFEKKASAIFGTFEASRDFLRNKEIYVVAGNPIRKGVLSIIGRDEAKKTFHLSQAKKIIFAIGGSQGAMKINELMYGLKKQFPNDFKSIGIIWSTGDFSYARYKQQIQDMDDEGSVYLSPFIANVGAAYQACDLAISRSGAGVMMELAAMGVPSILIPYPFAADNHQQKNAEVFEKEGASILIGDEEATPEKVAPLVFELLKNSRKLGAMAEKAMSAARRDSQKIIADGILKVIKG